MAVAKRKIQEVLRAFLDGQNEDDGFRLPPPRPIQPVPAVPLGGFRPIPTQPVDIGPAPGDIVQAPPQPALTSPDLVLPVRYSPKAREVSGYDMSPSEAIEAGLPQESPVGNLSDTYAGDTATAPASGKPDYSLPSFANADLPTYSGDLARAAAKMRDLEMQPLPKLSRKKAALKGLIYGLGQGLATGNVAAGVGGALTGLTAGAIAPGRTARLVREEDLNRANQDFMRVAKRAQVMGTIDAQQALAKQRLLEPALKLAQYKREDYQKEVAALFAQVNHAGHYDPNDTKDPTSQAILKRAKELNVENQLIPYKKTDRAPRLYKADDGITYEEQPDGSFAPSKTIPPAPRYSGPEGIPISAHDYTQWKIGQGNRQEALGERKTERQIRQEQKDEDEARHDDEKLQARREKAGNVMGFFKRSLQRYIDFQHRIDAADAKTKAQVEAQWSYPRDLARSDMEDALTELGAYNDLVEVGVGEDPNHTPYVKWKDLPARKPKK